MKRDLAGVRREWRTRAWTGGGDDSDSGLVTKKKGTYIDDWNWCQPHPGLQGTRGEQQVP